MANLKSKVDKLDVDKLKPIPTDLSKLSDVVKNDVVKKTDYNKLVAKVDNIDTSGLVKKTDYNTKITEIDDKIPDSSSLATKTALSAVENKISSISNFSRKQIMIQQLLKSKRNLLIISMINILAVQSLIL